MSLFLRSVRFTITAPAALLLGALSVVAAGGYIGIPVIDSGRAFGELPYTALLPLAFVIVIGAIEARAAPLEAAASARRHAVLLTLVICANAALYAIADCATLAAMGGIDLAAARNAIGYTGLLFIGQAVLGLKRAPIVPAIYLIVATVFGRIHGVIQPWAWPATPAAGPDVLAALIMTAVAAMMACGCARYFPARFYA
ncbi:MAG: hypothetical protein J0J05_03635 [Microbacterium sp.]|uniref:hypothetical protein n=1 Tax=Microbacterium sp. TaxID=51671 RepID=UPI001ACFB54B|nr:hypothetical protein [Microbacterium sp.]MBN9153059.1 hypothetical protein [Microbacterium sp.]